MENGIEIRTGACLAGHTFVKHVADEDVAADGHIFEQRQVCGPLVNHAEAILREIIRHLNEIHIR